MEMLVCAKLIIFFILGKLLFDSLHKNINMEGIQSRVQDAITKMVDSLDKEHFRKMQVHCAILVQTI